MQNLPVNISNDSLNIIIGIGTVIIALLSFGEEIGRFLYFFKVLSFRIITLLLCSFLIIGATVIKDKNNDVKNSNDLHIRDSLNRASFNMSLEKSSNALGNTLAKYKLGYDSAQKKVYNLVKDSLSVGGKSLIPFIDINDIKTVIEHDSLVIITPSIWATQGIASDLYFNYCSVIKLGNELQFIKGLPTTKMIGNISSDPFNFTYTLIGDKNMLSATIYLCIYGSYKDASSTGNGSIKSYPLLTIKSFNLKTYGYYGLGEKEFKMVQQFIEKNKIKLPKS